MTDTLLIRNVRPAGGAATDVLVRDGRIAAIGTGATGGDASFDAGGRLMIPGLVEAHTHLDKSFWGMGWHKHTAGPALIDKIETERQERPHAWDAIVEATVLRFRPIMLTAISTVLGFIPIASDVFWGPMALAIMGGLFVATLLTLIVLPALYRLVHRQRR